MLDPEREAMCAEVDRLLYRVAAGDRRRGAHRAGLAWRSGPRWRMWFRRTNGSARIGNWCSPRTSFRPVRARGVRTDIGRVRWASATSTVVPARAAGQAEFRQQQTRLGSPRLHCWAPRTGGARPGRCGRGDRSRRHREEVTTAAGTAAGWRAGGRRPAISKPLGSGTRTGQRRRGNGQPGSAPRQNASAARKR